MADENPNNAPEQESDIGMDEAWTLNNKRTYDEFLQESLETLRQCRTRFGKVMSDEQTQTNTINNLSIQALQNAVETANLVSKQAVRHSDIAIDRQWNVDEQGYTAGNILGSDDVADAVAAKILAAMAEKQNA